MLFLYFTLLAAVLAAPYRLWPFGAGYANATTSVSSDSAQGEFAAGGMGADAYAKSVLQKYATTSVSDSSETTETLTPKTSPAGASPIIADVHPSGASAVISEAPLPFDQQYQGIFGQMCKKVNDQFHKLGECIAKTDQFKQLNSTFWYQASRQALCGTPMQYVPKTKKTNTTVSSPAHVKTGSPESRIKLKSLAHPSVEDDDVKLLSHLPETVAQHDNAELQAQYLFLLRKETLAAEGKDVNDPMNYISGPDAASLSENEKRMFLEAVPGATLTIGSCVTLCDILRQGSNVVDKCWETTSLSVLYGVCTVGCYYAFL